MHVEFHGAAGEVTGSSHLVHIGGRRVLLDCGMHQGGRDEYKRNSAPFAFEAAALDAVVLSHAHIDHLGRLPLLARRGYRGPIYTQKATAELARVMLEDAARLTMSDARSETRWRERRGLKPVKPWFDLDDVERVLRQLVPLSYDAEHEILGGVRIRLSDAGHIIGAAIVELWAQEGGRERKLVFSGDIGPNDAPFLPDPTRIESADLVLMESTYGDRLHRSRPETVAELGTIFRDAVGHGAAVLIPAFAVGRTQELLYWMAHHYQEWQLERFRIFIDSPMAAKVIDVYRHHEHQLEHGALHAAKGGMSPFRMPNLRIVTDESESRALNSTREPFVVIAGSGMCNGGRIRHHLKHHVWRPQTHVVIAGYQAQGTLGRQIVDGAAKVRIFGEPIRVAAQVHTIGGLSAHADQQGLLDWYGAIAGHPPACLVHGEDPAREVLATTLREKFGTTVTLTRPGMSVEV